MPTSKSTPMPKGLVCAIGSTAFPRSFGASAAAFDTRIDGPATLTGRASKGIARRLRHHGLELIAGPESFLVDKHNHLLDGEADRAQEWASKLATTVDRAESRP